jgi:hypothetical protein
MWPQLRRSSTRSRSPSAAARAGPPTPASLVIPHTLCYEPLCLMPVEDVHLLAYSHAMRATSKIEQPLQAKRWHMCDKMCLAAADDDDELQSQAADFDAALDLLPEAAPLAGSHSEPHEMLPLQLPPPPQHLLNVQPRPAPEAIPRYQDAPSAQQQEGMAAAEPGDADGLPGVELVFEDPPPEDDATGSGAAGWDAGPASTPQLLHDPAACNLDGSNGADASVLPAASGPLQHLHGTATSAAAARRGEGAAASNCVLPAADRPSLANTPATAQACTTTMPAAVPPTDWPADHTAELPQLGWQQQASVGCPAQWWDQQHTASCQMQALTAGVFWGDDADDCIPIVEDDDDGNGCAADAVVDSAAGAIQTHSSLAVQQIPTAEQPQPPGKLSAQWLAASDSQAHEAQDCSPAAAAGTTKRPWSPTLSAAEGALQEGTAAASPCNTEELVPAAAPQPSWSDPGSDDDGGGGCEIVFDENAAGLGSGGGMAAGTPAGSSEVATGMLPPHPGAGHACMCRWPS